jgi:transcriptional regulator with XRE-family HTH domain
MVSPRKNIPSHIANNLVFLRKQRGLTLEQMADQLGLQGKTSYYAYEQGKVLPDIFKLLKLAGFFEVSVEELVNRDLSQNLSQREGNLNGPLFEVERVPVKARAGYTASYGDPVWISKLKTIKIPYKPFGIARAFEVEGDSMEPEIEEGTTVVAIKIDRTGLRNNKVYVIVTDHGIQCKEVHLNNDVLYLISKNKSYPPLHIEKSDVRELWEVWKKIKPGESWESPGLG